MRKGAIAPARQHLGHAGAACVQAMSAGVTSRLVVADLDHGQRRVRGEHHAAHDVAHRDRLLPVLEVDRLGKARRP